jgi:hypothetical protein
MTAAAFVSRTRVLLVGTTVCVALLWGAAIGILLGALWGVAIVAVLLWRGRRAWSIQRVALWIEEQAPTFQYAVVTAVDPHYAGRVGALPSAPGAIGRATMVRSIGLAVLALALAATVRVFHRGPITAVLRPATTTAMANRLTTLAVHVIPPAYVHGPTRELRDPTTVTALVGSQIEVEGQQGWRSTFTMPAAPSVEHLTDRQYRRLLVLAPIADAPPTVMLTRPSRDAVMKEPATGTLQLTAAASDDIGLATGYFEYLITSGDEETGGVKGRGGHTTQVAFRNASTDTLRATLRLDSLGLAAGDLLSVRAVVFDGNTLTGPGKGVSETRSIRVLSRHAYDSLAVDAEPPEGVDTVDKVEIGRRLYLRGAPPTIVVDVAGVRLHGADPATIGQRTPGTPLPPSLWPRFQAAVALLGSSRSAAIDSLAALRVDTTDATLAAALDDALAAFHQGTDPAPALLRARRALLQ